MSEPIGKIPSVILTGFLGSGKTTLINRLLKDPQFQQAAVLMNEFGEVPLDHELIAHSEERLVVLSGGCVCCALREDVEGALRQLFEQRDAGTIPAFDRVIIETTGLADPIPLMMTLQTFGLARERLAAPTVVTTVDAELFGSTMARHPQAARQVAAAHAVIVTKADIAGEERSRHAAAEVGRLNPWARTAIGQVPADAALLARLLDESARDAAPQWGGGLLDSAVERTRQGWLSGRYVKTGGSHSAESFPVIFDAPVDWTAFGVWLTLLLHRHGQNILRVKGLLNVDGLRGPVAVHAAQHLVHPPEHLDEWPSKDRRTRLIFIVDGVDPGLVARSLHAFLRTGSTLSAGLGDTHYVRAGGGGTVRGRPVRRPTAPGWIRG